MSFPKVHQWVNKQSQVAKLLKDFYIQSQKSGIEDEKQQEFIKGFMSAGLFGGLVDQAILNEIITVTHQEVFGMELAEKHQERLLQGKETSYHDVPPFIRKGIRINVP